MHHRCRWQPTLSVEKIMTSIQMIQAREILDSRGNPTVEVTTLGLSTLELGALQADPCVAQRSKQSCAQYPNPNSCDQLRISIRGDGSTVGTCSKKGQPDKTLKGVSAGIPIVCRMDATGGCVRI